MRRKRKRPALSHRWSQTPTTWLLGTPLDASYSVLAGSPAPPPPAPQGPPGRGGRGGRRHPETAQPPATPPDVAAEMELFVDRAADRPTPLSVQTAKFRRSRLGYNMREVDRYLDEVAAEMARLHKRLLHPTDDAPAKPAPTTGDAEPPTITKVRTLATRCASQIISDALIQAARIYERAHQQADELLADARDAQQQSSRFSSSSQAVSERPVSPLSARGAAIGLVLPGPWPSSGRQT